jgi:hypothetical protein
LGTAELVFADANQKVGTVLVDTNGNMVPFKPQAMLDESLKQQKRIAELEAPVAKVNPAPVLPDKEGKPYTVRYDAVNVMLLNEFLKEHRKVEQLEKQVEALTAGLQKVSAQLEASKPAPQVVNNR